MQNNDKLEFFSDLKEKFLLVLGGIISLSTVIPAFINHSSEIFGWENISSGYNLFVLLYFITPYLFYMVFCNIYSSVGFFGLIPWSFYRNLDYLMRLLLEGAVIIGIYYWLVYNIPWLNSALCCILFFLPIIPFVFILIKPVRNAKLKALKKEFIIICSVIVVVFSLFLFGIVRNEHKAALFKFDSAKQQQAFVTFDNIDYLNRNYFQLIRSASEKADKYRNQAIALEPGLHIPANIRDTVSGQLWDIHNELQKIENTPVYDKKLIDKHVDSLNRCLENVLRQDSSCIYQSDKRYRTLLIGESLIGLRYYAEKIRRDKQNQSNREWAGLLKVLQLKSLCWFFLLIMLGLCLWIRKQYVLVKLESDRQEMETMFIPSNISSVLRTAAEMQKQEKVENLNTRISLTTDDLAQIKSRIFLLFVLTVPWFRTIDEHTVDRERPFLNISLAGLINGSYQQPTTLDTGYTCQPQNTCCKPKEQDPIPNDSTQLRITGGLSQEQDSLIRAINRNVTQNTGLIKQLGRKTIGDAEERRPFNQ
jgi:hypothetical protein